MKHSYSIEEIREADREAIGTSSSLVLMQRAAEGLASVTLGVMEEKGLSDVLFVCGGGNNGGDGFAAAQLLLEAGKEVSALCLAEKFSDECLAMKKRFRGEILGRIPRRRYSLVVDCLLGTGIDRAPEGDMGALIGFINQSGAFVISCDLPSGLGENGIAFEPCVRADRTVTIGGMKHALLLSDGADVAGEVSVSPIGLSLSRGAEVWEDGDVSAFFPKRKSNVHKGNFGSACIFAGGALYTGAAFLSAGACLKSGAGYTKMSVAEPLYSLAVGKLPACVLREFHAIDGEMLGSDCIAMGMGAGINERVYAHIVELLSAYTGTLVLDADALNSLSFYGKEVLRNKTCRVILTPHPREFSRLVGRSVEDVLRNAVSLAEEFAAQYGVVLVLKGNRTIIADGTRLAINPTGSPVLAKGGSGDVLTGFLAGTCARGVPPFDACCVSSYLLGRAGELAAEDLGEYAPDASDIVAYLPKAILSLEK